MFIKSINEVYFILKKIDFFCFTFNSLLLLCKNI